MSDSSSSSSPGRGERGGKRWLFPILLIGIAALIAQRIYLLPEPVPTFDVSQMHPRVQEAIEDAVVRVETDRSSVESWGRLGMLGMIYQFQPQAEACFRQAAKLDPQEVRWPYYLGIVQEAANQEQSLESYRRATALEPGLDFVRLKFVENLLVRGKLNEARKELEELVDKETSVGRAELRMAQLELQEGNDQSALRWSKDAAQRQPGRRDVYELAAQIQAKAGNREAAEKAQAIAQSRNPVDPPWPDPFMLDAQQLRVDPEYIAQQAKMLLAAGASEKAVEIYKRLVEQEPKGTQFRTELAEIYLDFDRLDAAAKLLEEGIGETPDSPPIVGLLATTYLLQERWEESRSVFERATQLQPTYAPFYIDLGYVLLRLGQQDEALESLDQSIQVSKDSKSATLQVAELLVDEGLDEAAGRKLKAVLALEPGNSRALELQSKLSEDQ